MSLVNIAAVYQFSQIFPQRQNNLPPEGDFNCFNRWSPEFIGWADHIKQIRPPPSQPGLCLNLNRLWGPDRSSPIVWLTLPILLSHFEIKTKTQPWVLRSPPQRHEIYSQKYDSQSVYFAHCQFGFCQLLWIVGVGAGRWQWMTDPDIILHLSIAQPPVPITALKSIALRAVTWSWQCIVQTGECKQHRGEVNLNNAQSFLVSPISIRAIGNVWDPPLIRGSLKGKYRSGHAIAYVSGIHTESIHTDI